MKYTAIITGDLVDSSSLPSDQYTKVINHLDRILKQSNYIKSYEVFRGDAFQAMAIEPSDAIVAAIMLKLFMFSEFDDQRITMSVAIGEHINDEQPLGRQMSNVLITSGRNLETTTKGSITVTGSNETNSKVMDAIAKLLNENISSLNSLQRKILVKELTELSLTDTKKAKLLSVSNQSYSKSKIRGGIDCIAEAITSTKTLIQELMHD